MAESPDVPTDPAVTSATPTGPIVARAGKEYRVKRALLAVLLIGWGVWSAYDGFVKMPHDNQAYYDKNPGGTKPPHPAYDVPFNVVLAIAMPPLGVILVLWAFYASRGEYRLDGDTLRVPGHPPIPLSAVTAVDRAKWDRKGIAVVEYKLAKGRAGKARLDDFIYQREPTDQIYDRVLATVAAPAEPTGSNASAAGSSAT